MIESATQILNLIANLFRKYTENHDVRVLVFGRDAVDSERLRRIMSMDGIPDRRFEKVEEICVPVKHTEPGNVLEGSPGKVTSRVDHTVIDEKWVDRPKYIRSCIVWPISVSGRVEAVLKIESSKRDLFHDTIATRFLAQLSARKLGAILETARCLEKLGVLAIASRSGSFPNANALKASVEV